jgi:cytochrome c5
MASEFCCCPFCDCDVITVDSARAPDEGYQATCTVCHACGPLEVTEAEAIEAWNERV